MGSIGRGEFLDYLSDYQLFKNKETTGTNQREQENKHNKKKREKIQEVLGITIRVLSFDTTQTGDKTKKLSGTHRQQGDLISLISLKNEDGLQR
jgi:hypothetical protein